MLTARLALLRYYLLHGHGQPSAQLPVHSPGQVQPGQLALWAQCFLQQVPGSEVADVVDVAIPPATSAPSTVNDNSIFVIMGLLTFWLECAPGDTPDKQEKLIPTRFRREPDTRKPSGQEA